MTPLVLKSQAALLSIRDQENATATSFLTPWTSPKRVNPERVNTKYTAKPDTDGSSERAKEKSPQEPVPIKWASQFNDFSMEYLKSGCPWKTSSLAAQILLFLFYDVY